MTFDLITENEHLWTVRYDDCLDNVLDSILGQWNDVTWLRSFFKHNIDDLASYFKITDVNQAIYDTIEDSERLQCLIDKMEELGMTQKRLSELMGCSQQYVSKVLKGQENLSLETLAKIESCLQLSILNHLA